MPNLDKLAAIGFDIYPKEIYQLCTRIMQRFPVERQWCITQLSKADVSFKDYVNRLPVQSRVDALWSMLYRRADDYIALYARRAALRFCSNWDIPHYDQAAYIELAYQHRFEYPAILLKILSDFTG